jgi:hypothetical protein
MFTPVDMCAHAVGAAAKSRASARMAVGRYAGDRRDPVRRPGGDECTQAFDVAAMVAHRLRIEAHGAVDLGQQRGQQVHVGVGPDRQHRTGGGGRLDAARVHVHDASAARLRRLQRLHRMGDRQEGHVRDRRVLADQIRMKSERSMSGTGCRVRVPNTACDPANLFEQSWVPELKCLRTPNWPMKRAYDGPCRLLNAAGLPT